MVRLILYRQSRAVKRMPFANKIPSVKCFAPILCQGIFYLGAIMKYGNNNYLEFNRLANDENHRGMSDACYRLYGTLKELEQVFCDKYNNVFYYTDKDLAILLNWSLSKVVRTKKELKNYPDLVEMQSRRYKKINGEYSVEPVTFYLLF